MGPKLGDSCLVFHTPNLYDATLIGFRGKNRIIEFKEDFDGFDKKAIYHTNNIYPKNKENVKIQKILCRDSFAASGRNKKLSWIFTNKGDPKV